MPKELAKHLRAERAVTEAISVPQSPKPHPLVESWPKPQKPSYGAPGFTPQGESRRRRIASVLFREIERHGGSVVPSKEHPTNSDRFDVIFIGESIEVIFQERLQMTKIPADPKQPYSYERREWHPTGQLRLRFENYLDVPIRREWNDTETKRIEDRLREILIALYRSIEAERQRSERFRLAAARRAEEERRRWEREGRERHEREAVESLLAEANAWEDAQRTRNYVRAMKASGVRNSEWVQWALSVADRLDPSKG